MYNICHVRHTINTKDTFFEAENNFFDDNNPAVEALTNKFYALLLNSRFRKELEKKWGNQLFVIAELSLKTFKPSILEDLKEENKLISEYVKIKASAEIVFRGEKIYFANFISLGNVQRSTNPESSFNCQMGLLCRAIESGRSHF